MSMRLGKLAAAIEKSTVAAENPRDFYLRLNTEYSFPQIFSCIGNYNEARDLFSGMMDTRMMNTALPYTYESVLVDYSTYFMRKLLRTDCPIVDRLHIWYQEVFDDYGLVFTGPAETIHCYVPSLTGVYPPEGSEILRLQGELFL